jgi:hypothetical protein
VGYRLENQLIVPEPTLNIYSKIDRLLS